MLCPHFDEIKEHKDLERNTDTESLCKLNCSFACKKYNSCR